MQDFGSTMVWPPSLSLGVCLVTSHCWSAVSVFGSCAVVLFRVNPFTLDQYIDGWCRSGQDSLERFVLQVSLDPDRS